MNNNSKPWLPWFIPIHKYMAQAPNWFLIELPVEHRWIVPFRAKTTNSLQHQPEVGLVVSRSIAPDAFQAVPSLQRLDLAKNQLSGILDPTALRGPRDGGFSSGRGWGCDIDNGWKPKGRVLKEARVTRQMCCPVVSELPCYWYI